MTILDTIAEANRERVAQRKKECSLEQLKDQLLKTPLRPSFCFEQALRTKTPALICEVKKASPSKGIISEDFPYLQIAMEYQKIGAACISVLTEPKWFLGSDEIFCAIREKVAIPMLRKDFTVDPYQIYEAKAMGADAILLICSLLPTEVLKEYLELATSLGLSTLVETHDEKEVESALLAGATILGVNNRNLKTFDVDLQNASRLKAMVPENILFVAESGIKTPQDGIGLVSQGANALLIGEALMRSSDKKAFVDEIILGS